jgi:hypothetical protein
VTLCEWLVLLGLELNLMRLLPGHRRGLYGNSGSVESDMNRKIRRIGRLAGFVIAPVAISFITACGSSGTTTASPPLATNTPSITPSTISTGSPAAVPGSESSSRTPLEPGSEFSSSTPDPSYLADLTAVASSPSPFSGPSKINAHQYLKSLWWQSYGSDVSVEYDLNRQWKFFLAVVGLKDDAPADARVTFRVFVDGQLRDTETDVMLGHPKPVGISAQDGLRLKLTVIQTAGASSTPAVWGDAEFTNNASLRPTL